MIDKNVKPQNKNETIYFKKTRIIKTHRKIWKIL